MLTRLEKVPKRKEKKAFSTDPLHKNKENSTGSFYSLSSDTVFTQVHFFPTP